MEPEEEPMTDLAEKPDLQEGLIKTCSKKRAGRSASNRIPR